MKSKILWALAGLNLGLALMLVFGSVAENQAMAQSRVMRPADYILVPGDVPGADAGVVYIIDSSNGMLGAMTYNSKDNLDIMQPVNIARLFEGTPAAR